MFVALTTTPKRCSSFSWKVSVPRTLLAVAGATMDLSKIGGEPTPAVGFAMGIERTILAVGDSWQKDPDVDLYLWQSVILKMPH